MPALAACQFCAKADKQCMEAAAVRTHLEHCVDLVPVLQLGMHAAQAHSVGKLFRRHALLDGVLYLTGRLIQPVHLRNVLQYNKTVLDPPSTRNMLCYCTMRDISRAQPQAPLAPSQAEPPAECPTLKTR